MKKLIWIIFALFVFFESSGQRYELWVGTPENKYNVKGNYGFSNDTVLMLFTNSSLLFPTRDKYFNWEDVNSLKIRNKTRNQMGKIIGAGAGFLAVSMINNSLKNNSYEEGLGVFNIIVLPVVVSTGLLVGHLATNKKRSIPIQGMNPKDKNRLMKSAVKTRK